MKKLVKTGVIIIFTFLFSSCATLFYGKSDRVRFESEPSGAVVYVNGRDTKQKTPCEINVVREKYTRGFSWTTFNYLHYEYRMDGYTPVKDVIYSKKNPLFYLDIFALLWIVDISAERVYKYNTTVSKQLNIESSLKK
jgi:hypothetical protein